MLRAARFIPRVTENLSYFAKPRATNMSSDLDTSVEGAATAAMSSTSTTPTRKRLDIVVVSDVV